MQNAYPPPQRDSIWAVRPTNGLGVAGFIVSLVGLVVTCGLLCPLGLLLSVLALFKRPRGMAIAGTVIGLVGTFWIVSFLFLITAASVNHRERAETSQRTAMTEQTLAEARRIIEEHRTADGRAPAGIEGNKLLLELSDAWGSSIRYDLQDDASYLVRSAGQDGQFNTEDDLTLASGNSESRGK